MIDGVSIAKAAKRSDVDDETPYRWRHRLLASLAVDKGETLSGIVELDEMYSLESYKGMRSGMPRAASKRGDKSPKFGLSAEQIPVIVARDRQGASTDAVLAKTEPDVHYRRTRRSRQLSKQVLLRWWLGDRHREQNRQIACIPNIGHQDQEVTPAPIRPQQQRDGQEQGALGQKNEIRSAQTSRGKGGERLLGCDESRGQKRVQASAPIVCVARRNCHLSSSLMRGSSNRGVVSAMRKTSGIGQDASKTGIAERNAAMRQGVRDRGANQGPRLSSLAELIDHCVTTKFVSMPLL